MKKYNLLDVAKMLLNIPLDQEVEIDSVEVNIKYISKKGIECVFKETLGKITNETD